MYLNIPLSFLLCKEWGKIARGAQFYIELNYGGATRCAAIFLFSRMELVIAAELVMAAVLVFS